MTLVQWIGEKLGYFRRRPDRAEAAIRLTDEVVNQARSIRQQLEPFAMERDPFLSIIRKNKLADDYETATEFDQTPRAK